MAQKYHIPIDPPKTSFAEIGEFMARWAWIENQTTVLVRELLRLTKPESWIVISDIPIRARLIVLKTLSDELLKKHAQLQLDIAGLFTKIDKIRKFRNGMAHCFVVQVPDARGKLAIATRRKTMEGTELHPDTEMIKDLGGKIQQLREVQADAQLVTDSLKALRGKSR